MISGIEELSKPHPLRLSCAAWYEIAQAKWSILQELVCFLEFLPVPSNFFWTIISHINNKRRKTEQETSCMPALNTTYMYVTEDISACKLVKKYLSRQHHPVNLLKVQWRMLGSGVVVVT